VNTIYILKLDSDTSEPWESYRDTDLLKAFITYPTKAQIYKIIKDLFPCTPNLITWIQNMGSSLYVDDLRYEWYVIPVDL
jgi:hypothetical protein